jgi:hypothetical protein
VGAQTVGAPCGCPNRWRPLWVPKPLAPIQSQWLPQWLSPTIGDIVGAFKSITTHEYIIGVKNNNWPEFNKKLWQRNYYEHIIRNEKSLNKIREYIINNPFKWDTDRNNPVNFVKK